MKLFRIAAIAGVCLLGLLLAIVIGKRGGTETGPEAVEVVNVEEIRALAANGEAAAQYKLGALLTKGQEVEQDYAEAAQWHRKAAEQGNAAAQRSLAELYEAGQGVPLDPAEAARWFRQAAEQGDVVAQYSLAVLHVMGKGVARDIPEAVKWYRRAAEQGDSLAQFNLGVRHAEGDGVAQDPVEAYKWFSLAAAQGVEDAVRARDSLTSKMTREQIAEGRRRTEAFTPRKPGA
jgi:TPR repeat protein